MPVIEQSTIDSWLSRTTPSSLPPESHGEPRARLLPGEVPCPFCGSPATPFPNAEIEGVYQCDPFVEGSCMRLFVPKPVLPECVGLLAAACRQMLTIDMIPGRELLDPTNCQMAATSNAAYDALASYEAYLAGLECEK